MVADIFSNYGATSVDIAAPGVNIASTYSSGGYVYLDGTSMATPHVTGVVALVRTQDPTLSVASTVGRILNNADTVTALANKVVGNRRLNAFRAVNTGGADLTGPRITAAAPNGTTSVSSVRLTCGVRRVGGLGRADDERVIHRRNGPL